MTEFDPATHRMDVSLKRSPGAKRNNWQAIAGAYAQNLADLLGVFGKANEIWKCRRMRAFAMAVVLAHNLRHGHTISKQ